MMKLPVSSFQFPEWLETEMRSRRYFWKLETGNSTMAVTHKRVWLTFGNATMVKTPALWRMTSRFPDVSFDIRQASVTAEIGIMAVLFEGETERVEAALQCLKDQGVTVEPIEK